MSYFTSLRFIIKLIAGIGHCHAQITIFSDFTMPHMKVSQKHKIEKSHKGSASWTQEWQVKWMSKGAIMRRKQRSESGAGNDPGEKYSNFCSILGPFGCLSSDIREHINFVAPAIKRQLKGEKIRKIITTFSFLEIICYWRALLPGYMMLWNSIGF